MSYSVRPHAFGWAVVEHDHPGGTVIEVFDSKSAAITCADALREGEATTTGDKVVVREG